MDLDLMNQSGFFGYAQNNPKNKKKKKRNKNKKSNNNANSKTVVVNQSAHEDFASGFAEFQKAYNTLLNQNDFSNNDFAEIELELRFGLSKMIESKTILNSQNHTIDPNNILDQTNQDLDKKDKIYTEEDMKARYKQIEEIKNNLFQNQTTPLKMPVIFDNFTEKVRSQENERIRSQEEINKIERLTEAINNTTNLFLSVNNSTKKEFCQQVNNNINELRQLIMLDSQNSGTRIKMLTNLTLRIDSTQEDIQNIITIIGLVSRVTLTKKRNPQDLLSSTMVIKEEAEQGNHWPDNISGQVAYITNLTISDELKLFVLQLMWWSIVGKEFTEDEQDVSKTTPSFINLANTPVTDRKIIYNALWKLREKITLREKNENNKDLIINILPSIIKEQNQDIPWFYNHDNLNNYLETLTKYKETLDKDKSDLGQDKLDAFSNFIKSVELWFKGTNISLKKKKTSPIEIDKKTLLLKSLKKEKSQLKMLCDPSNENYLDNKNFIEKQLGFVKGINSRKINGNNNAPNNDLDREKLDIYLNQSRDYAVKRLKKVKKQITKLENNNLEISNDTLLQCLQGRLDYLNKLSKKIPTIDLNVECEYIDIKDGQKKTANINVNYNKKISEKTEETYLEEIQNRINKEIAELQEKINSLNSISPKEISLNDVLNSLGRDPFTELQPTVTITLSHTNPFPSTALHNSTDEQETKKPISSNITTTTTMIPSQPTDTEKTDEQKEIEKAILFMNKFIDSNSHNQKDYDFIKLYIHYLHTLTENYNNQNFSTTIKNLLKSAEIIKYINVITNFYSSTQCKSNKFTQRIKKLKYTCAILVKHGHTEFTLITDKMRNKRIQLSRFFNSFDNCSVFIDPSYNYKQTIKDLYPRPIADKEDREYREKQYEQAVLKNNTEYEKGIKELNLPSEENNFSYLYESSNLATALSNEINSDDFNLNSKTPINQLKKNYYIYTELLNEIFKDLEKNKGFFSTLWNFFKYKRAINSFKERQYLLSNDMIANFNNRINNYQSISWTAHFCESIRYICLEWLSNLIFPNF